MPKKGKDMFCDIANARMRNKTIRKWGTRLFTARNLAASLEWRAIVEGFNISDSYHILLLTSCTGNLVMGFGITGVQRIYKGDWSGVCPSWLARTGRCSRPLARKVRWPSSIRLAPAHRLLAWQLLPDLRQGSLLLLLRLLLGLVGCSQLLPGPGGQPAELHSAVPAE